MKDMDNVIFYLGDVVVFSETVSEHGSILQNVFDSLLEVGLSINIKKCGFKQNEIENRKFPNFTVDHSLNCQK